ncbi:unnamed protein product [Symbiodinium necroappetens]|uniref:Reverse transcriptase domain-containing protein n=1 Tax=Symbiodinium necroappetens TaxID=1628268 RepID=A0A812WCB3_9DINO|nr:unnamed protein product [Symbiodinium necroappetens]
MAYPSTEGPITPRPHSPSPSFAIRPLAFGTGPQHHHATASYTGLHAWTCQDHLPRSFFYILSWLTRRPDQSNCARTSLSCPCLRISFNPTSTCRLRRTRHCYATSSHDSACARGLVAGQRLPGYPSQHWQPQLSSTCCVILLKKELPAFPVTNLHPAHFLYQGWNSYWLRWIAAGKEAYFIVARTKAEMVLAGEAWINSLTLNDRKQSELQDWLKQVEDWVEAQDTDDFLTKIRRTAVIWGVPPATVTKLQKQPLAKLIAVGSYMERCVFRVLGIVPGYPSFQQFSAESVLYLRFSPIKKHAKLFYVGSTEKSVMIREHSRFRKYKQVLEEKLVSAELSIRFWAHHRTFWNWCIIPVTDVVPHDLLRGREQALIQTLQPPLNFPFIARWFCPCRGIIKPPDATHAQKIGLSRLWRKRRKKQHSGAGPPRGLTEVFEQIWEKHLTQAFSKGDVYELLRQDLAGFFNSISQSQFLHAWRINLEFYRQRHGAQADTTFSVNLKEQAQQLRVFRGRRRTRASREVTIWCEDLPTIIRHALALQHFRVSTRNFRQCFGSPMGSPLSPALCGMVIAAQEEIWRRTFNISCSNMSRSLLGLRYVDNRLWLSESRFEQLPGIRLLLNNHFYGGSIILEEEPAFEFVGFTLDFEERRILYSRACTTHDIPSTYSAAPQPVLLSGVLARARTIKKCSYPRTQALMDLRYLWDLAEQRGLPIHSFDFKAKFWKFT